MFQWPLCARTTPPPPGKRRSSSNRYVIERFEVLPVRAQYNSSPIGFITTAVKQLECQKYRRRPTFIVHRDNLTVSTPVSVSTMSRSYPDCVQDAQHETRCRTAWADRHQCLTWATTSSLEKPKGGYLSSRGGCHEVTALWSQEQGPTTLLRHLHYSNGFGRAHDQGKGPHRNATRPLAAQHR